MELSECSYTFEHIPGTPNLLADYLSRCNFENNQETLATNSKLIHEKHALPIVNDSKVNKTPHAVNCLISGNENKKDPLLEISNQTFVQEQIKDPELAPIYNEIVKKGSSSKYPNYFIHPDSKILMFKKENVINNTFSYLIIVPLSLRSKVLTIMWYGG